MYVKMEKESQTSWWRWVFLYLFKIDCVVNFPNNSSTFTLSIKQVDYGNLVVTILKLLCWLTKEMADCKEEIFQI